MAKSLSELDLKEEALPAQSFDDLPEFGGFTPPPQPGPYRFRLPADLSKVWDVYDSKKGQRIRAIFDRDHPLTIIASPGNAANGDVFQTRLSNQERKRGDVEASDLDYLLRAKGEKTRPMTNKAYAQAVLKYAGQEFGADITYSFRCSTERNIRVFNPTTQALEEIDKKGCGKGYYQKDLQRGPDGNFPHEITCECGAVLRVFANIENIRA